LWSTGFFLLGDWLLGRFANRPHLKCFALDLSEKEPAVIPHKIENRIELLLDEAGVVADNCNADNRDILAVLVIDFRDRDIEPALEPTDDALDNAPLALKARDTDQR